MLLSREEPPGVPALLLERGEKKKDERGRKKEGAFSNTRQRKTREALKLKRAMAPLGCETPSEGRGFSWPRERKPPERRCQVERFGRKA
jgi:hypothetical protein